MATKSALSNDKAQPALSELSKQTLLRVFEQSSEAVLISDKNNHITAVNAAFTRLTGYGSSDVFGQDPKLLSSGRSDPDLSRQMVTIC